MSKKKQNEQKRDSSKLKNLGIMSIEETIAWVSIN